MHCRQFETRLHDLLDERRCPAADAALAAHAARCPRCADLLASYADLLEAVSSQPKPLPDAGFVARVMDHAVKKPPAWRRWPAAVAGLAAAAAVLLAVNAHFQNGASRQARYSAADGVASKNARPGYVQSSLLGPGRRLAVAGGTLGPPRAFELREVGQRQIQHFARATGEQLAVVVLQIPDGQAGGSGEMAQPKWLAEVTSGLRPLTSSMAEALHLLRRTLPGSRSDASL